MRQGRAPTCLPDVESNASNAPQMCVTQRQLSNDSDGQRCAWPFGYDLEQIKTSWKLPAQFAGALPQVVVARYLSPVPKFCHTFNEPYICVYIYKSTDGRQKRKICTPHSCKDMEKDGDVGKCWSLVSGATLLNNVSETMQQVAGSNNFIWISFSTEPNRHAYYTMCAALWRLRLSKKARG